MHFTMVGEIKIIPYVPLPPVGPGCNPNITDNRKLYSLKWGFVTSRYYHTVESWCFEPPWKKQSGWNYSVKLAKGI